MDKARILRRLPVALMSIGISWASEPLFRIRKVRRKVADWIVHRLGERESWFARSALAYLPPSLARELGRQAPLLFFASVSPGEPVSSRVPPRTLRIAAEGVVEAVIRRETLEAEEWRTGHSILTRYALLSGGKHGTAVVRGERRRELIEALRRSGILDGTPGAFGHEDPGSVRVVASPETIDIIGFLSTPTPELLLTDPEIPDALFEEIVSKSVLYTHMRLSGETALEEAEGEKYPAKLPLAPAARVGMLMNTLEVTLSQERISAEMVEQALSANLDTTAPVLTQALKEKVLETLINNRRHWARRDVRAQATEMRQGPEATTKLLDALPRNEARSLCRTVLADDSSKEGEIEVALAWLETKGEPPPIDLSRMAGILGASSPQVRRRAFAILDKAEPVADEVQDAPQAPHRDPEAPSQGTRAQAEGGSQQRKPRPGARPPI